MSLGREDAEAIAGVNSSFPKTQTYVGSGGIADMQTVYGSQNTTKTITTTKEYDSEGRLVKETTVETTTTPNTGLKYPYPRYPYVTYNGGYDPTVQLCSNEN